MMKSKYGEVITGRVVSNIWLEELEARIATLERLIKPQPKEPVIEVKYYYKEKDRYIEFEPRSLESWDLKITYQDGVAIKAEVAE